MLGLYGDFVHLEQLGGMNFFSGGIEGALYFDQFTLHGLVRMHDGNLIDASFMSKASLAYYPIDDLKLHIGHSYAHGHNQFDYGAEWALSSQAGVMPSLFVNGSLADSGDSGVVLAGFRVYLGQHDKSLLRRHREDDPPDYLLSKYADFLRFDVHPWNIYVSIIETDFYRATHEDGNLRRLFLRHHF